MPDASPADELYRGSTNPPPMPKPTPPLPAEGAVARVSGSDPLRAVLCTWCTAARRPVHLPVRRTCPPALPARPPASSSVLPSGVARARGCRQALQRTLWAPCLAPAGLPIPQAAVQGSTEASTPALGGSGAAGLSSAGTSSVEPASWSGAEDAAAGAAVPLLAGGEKPASHGLRHRQRQEGVR